MFSIGTYLTLCFPSSPRTKLILEKLRNNQEIYLVPFFIGILKELKIMSIYSTNFYMHRFYKRTIHSIQRFTNILYAYERVENVGSTHREQIRKKERKKEKKPLFSFQRLICDLLGVICQFNLCYFQFFQFLL